MKNLAKIVRNNIRFLHATAILIGTMVGVGIFGVPFAFAKAGFWLGLLFLFLTGGITILVDLAFSEITLRTSARHQLVGYAGIYLGPIFKRVELFANMLGLYGALLAYIIISGEFLNKILSHFFYTQPSYYNVIFFVIVSLLVLAGIKTVKSVELFFAAVFSLVIILIFGLGLFHIHLSNFTSITPDFWFLPYGVLLFAFGGLSSIPIQRQILRGQEHLFKKSILTAVILVGILYFLFAFTVVGISGELTQPNALSGLEDFIGWKIVLLGSVFGIFAITTSFLMLGTALVNMFHFDYGIPKIKSWLLAMLPPFILFLGGLRTFIDVIGLVGAVAMGIESVILLLVFMRVKKHSDRVPEFSLKFIDWMTYPLIVVSLSGIVYALLVTNSGG